MLERLARNHPLPDGNKRTAFLLTADFLQANGRPLIGGEPEVDVAVVEQIAAGQSGSARTSGPESDRRLS